MQDSSIFASIQNWLNTDSLKENLKELFCQTLNWGQPKIQSFLVSVGSPVNSKITVYPAAQLSGLPVFRIDWDRQKLPNVSERRAVYRALAETYLEHLVCYVTSDGKQAAFVWPHSSDDKKKVELRSLPYEVGSPARTTIERLSKLAFSLEELGKTGEPNVSAVTDKLLEAFNVEAVTKHFFEAYKEVFDNLQKRLPKHSKDKFWAHDYALQLLNRLMFLYFIQKKRWLGDDPQFIRHFWEAYKSSSQPKDTFYDRWLSVLFFEAFSKKFQAGRSDRQHFPTHIRETLAIAPYLNGGLFSRNRLDDALAVPIPDDFFEMIFDSFQESKPGFFERYNFTITESTPFDVEVAVDPEMIGKVYESLVNITSEGISDDDRRGTAGIFYTPRVEIDLMCRLALVDWLTNHLGNQHKTLLYQAVFAYEPQEKEEADKALTEKKLWNDLNRLLREVTVCDPACGSGSFLVGMLLVLDDLQERASRVLGTKENPYERRRRIIGQSLYGVDVMRWAVDIAELRLWLQLVVETELDPEKLKFGPILPNLSFNVREGDSLVQEVGNINLGLHRTRTDLPLGLARKITQLKRKKLNFYQGGNQRQDEALLKHEELLLFREILVHNQQCLQEEIKAIRREIESQGVQSSFLDSAEKTPDRQSSRIEGMKRELEEKEEELERIKRALDALKSPGDLPFVWDIAFVEIFGGDRKGFDIVIGNPPYVRHERIAPPTLNQENCAPETWPKRKSEYKAKLQRSLALTYPHFFKGRRLDGKSDLFVYFYLHGLSLLDTKGSFCFITSNSWLDVGFGKDLQEFLLKHCHVKMILDNEAKRSFAQADINTIIALLSPLPRGLKDHGLEKTARFVMFKVPFEEVLSPVIFNEIEDAKERLVRREFRVCVVSQKTLYEEGLEQIEEENTTTTQQLLRENIYAGNKWGGKYLRAPDIFFTILEKGKGKLVPLHTIADVTSGIITGSNKQYYMKMQYPLPQGFKPVFKSPKDLKTITVTQNDAVNMIMIHNAPFKVKTAPLLWPDLRNDRHLVIINLDCLPFEHNFYGITPIKTGIEFLASFLNSTLSHFFFEVLSRTGLGGGAARLVKIDIIRFPVLNPAVISGNDVTRLFSAFKYMAYREIESILKEIYYEDRRTLDDVVFDVLGLTQREREAVYEAVIELVKKRLKKAKSV